VKVVEEASSIEEVNAEVVADVQRVRAAMTEAPLESQSVQLATTTKALAALMPQPRTEAAQGLPMAVRQASIADHGELKAGLRHLSDAFVALAIATAAESEPAELHDDGLKAGLREICLLLKATAQGLPLAVRQASIAGYGELKGELRHLSDAFVALASATSTVSEVPAELHDDGLKAELREICLLLKATPHAPSLLPRPVSPTPAGLLTASMPLGTVAEIATSRKVAVTQATQAKYHASKRVKAVMEAAQAEAEAQAAARMAAAAQADAETAAYAVAAATARAVSAEAAVRFLGDAESSLGDAESSLCDAKSSLGDSKSSLGDAESSLGDAESSLGDG
jgi:hypothetical protein